MLHVCDKTCWNFSHPSSPALGWPVGDPGELRPTNAPLYVQLHSSIQAVRLVHLLPGNYTEDLQLELRVVLLGSLPQYDALSYCWGKDISPRTAWVSGHALTIGSNLDCALRHLRPAYGHEPRVFWIDALCINQADVQERSAQVQLMSSIYSLAHNVIIWLGPGSPGFDPVFDCVRTNTIPSSFEERDEGLWLVRCLTILCNNPWFGRVWILQEMLLSRDDPLIRVGSEVISWSILLGFVVAVVEQAQVFVTKAAADGDDTVPWPTTDCRLFSTAARQLRLLGMLRRGGATTTIDRQISRTQYAQATDARDKVYGLLGICQFDDHHQIVADYSKSASVIFKEVMVLCMTKYRRLIYDDLPLHPTRVGRGEARLTTVSHPSWVVDLTYSCQELGKDTTHRYNSPLSLVSADFDVHELIAQTHGKAPLVKFTNNDSVLRTFGEYMGTVSATTGALLHSDEQDDWPKFVVPATMIYDIYHQYVRPRGLSVDQLYHALVRTPDTDRVGGGRTDMELFEDFVTSRMEAGHPALEEGKPHYVLAGLLAISCRNRTLFFTDEGHIGLSYHPDAVNGIHQDDVLVGLFGINLPVLLRPVHCDLTLDSTHGEHERFLLINIARVSGHKYGHGFDLDEFEVEWQHWTTLGLREYAIV
jgi:hypothetical protein